LALTGNQTVSGQFTAGGASTFNANGKWYLQGDPTTQLTANGYYGEAVTFGGGGSSTQYRVYQWKGGPAWSLTDANSAGNSKNLLGMAMGTEFNRGMLLRGYVYNSSWNWTSIGGELYLLAANTGEITQTQPTGSGDIVRVVGYAISADLIYFNPSQDWIELL
jgi:hypothetical protein